MIGIIVSIFILAICNGGKYEDKFLQNMLSIIFVAYILVRILSVFYY